MDLKDKVAFITGGASGLGRATAEHFVAAGAKVMLFDLNEDNARATAEEIGDNASYAAGDVADEDAVKAAIDKTIDTFGAIHVNVNSAGIGAAARTVGRDGPMPLKNFEFVLRVNLIGTFNVLRLCAEKMQENEPVTEDGERGVIVNVASVAAYDGQIGQAAYSASKGGVASMTLPIARDLCKQGIRVGHDCARDFRDADDGGRAATGARAIDRHDPVPAPARQPHRVRPTAAYIVNCGYINGEVIRLDSGIRMQPK
ncbi:MAG: SDR family NAD(P)-dependent oxidoreductase [Gammaproteobacteria bacterium]|nr:SDR family NAD(P)-dependent oxidoreductase [Gammaproteobacteria bacterium]